jgi:hypothetical protein
MKAKNNNSTETPVTFTTELVNGVPTQVPSTHRVVTSAFDGKTQVVEAKNTPFACSVGSETYWCS